MIPVLPRCMCMNLGFLDSVLFRCLVLSRCLIPMSCLSIISVTDSLFPSPFSTLYSSSSLPLGRERERERERETWHAPPQSRISSRRCTAPQGALIGVTCRPPRGSGYVSAHWSEQYRRSSGLGNGVGIGIGIGSDRIASSSDSP